MPARLVGCGRGDDDDDGSEDGNTRSVREEVEERKNILVEELRKKDRQTILKLEFFRLLFAQESLRKYSFFLMQLPFFTKPRQWF